MRRRWGFGYRLRALDFARTQATGTYCYSGRSTVNHSLYLTNVGLPGSVGMTVGVRNAFSENNALSANFTLCHVSIPNLS